MDTLRVEAFGKTAREKFGDGLCFGGGGGLSVMVRGGGGERDGWVEVQGQWGHFLGRRGGGGDV